MPNLFTKVKDRARAAAQPKPRTTHQVRGQVDTPFLLLTVLLVVVGLVMLLSASYPTAYYDIKHVTGGDAFYYFKRQALFAVLGLVVMYLVSKVNYQGLRGLAVLVLVLACLCMLAVKLPGLGVTAGGATRWLKYPIQWQPAWSCIFPAACPSGTTAPPWASGATTPWGASATCWSASASLS